MYIKQSRFAHSQFTTIFFHRVRLSWLKPTQGASNIGGYEIETLLSNATVHNSTEPYHQSVLDTCGKFFCQLRADFAYGMSREIVIKA